MMFDPEGDGCPAASSRKNAVGLLPAQSCGMLLHCRRFQSSYPIFWPGAMFTAPFFVVDHPSNV